MPPKSYPKLRLADGSAKGRIRRGFVPLEQLRRVVQRTEDLEERTIIKLVYFCALRASELGLQPAEHLDLKRGTLDVLRLKGSEGHTYKLEPWVLDDVKAWWAVRPPSKWLFCYHDFRRPGAQAYDLRLPLDRFCVGQIWKRAAVRAGLPKPLQHVHVLKHSVATHMLERGDDQLFVQHWLGHKNAASTSVYAEVVGKRLVEGQKVMQQLTKELE